ncbi:MAG: hypothetical protein ABEN55_17160, partial [Bradymonadaceae bacterium]
PTAVKRAFLSAYFGAELSTPSYRGHKLFRQPAFKLSRTEDVLEAGKQFVDQIDDLLQEFDSGDGPAMCPAPSNGSKFRKDSVVALGCGGAVVVSFRDGDGNAVKLKEGQSIQVYEYGGQCGGSDDTSKVSICTSQSPSNDILAEGTDENGDYATCGTGEAGSGNGTYSFPISSLPNSGGS